MIVVCVAYLLVPRPAATAARPAGSHSIKTLFLIVMENHNWSSIRGNNGSAPYINRTVLPASSYATRYYNPPGNHPSLPNYLWLEGGRCFSYCGTDTDPTKLIRSTHLTTLLTKHHISWMAYEEGIHDGACPRSDAGAYAVRHDPYMYFRDVAGNTRVCVAHIKSYDDFSGDLKRNRVARYNFITPNLCHDMHDPCLPINNPIKQGDSWLSRQIPLIERSKAYRDGGAIFITWDEGEGGDGPIGMILLSPDAKGHGYSSRIHYTHSSTLRTLEEILGVRPFLGASSRASDLHDLFRKFP